MRPIRLLLVAVLLPCSLRALAQTFDFAKNRIPVAELDGLARFQTGDDMGWADPAFDDSHWPLLRLDQTWNDQGYKNYSGLAWYRVRITLPQNSRNLALFVPHIQGSYEIYANGTLMGRLGGLPPQPTLTDATNQLFLLPVQRDAGASPLIAIRVWLPPRWAVYGGGPGKPLLIGDADRLMQWRTLQVRSTYWDLSANSLEFVVFLIVGFAGWILFLMRRGEREYLWFAAFQSVAALDLLAINLHRLYVMPDRAWLVGYALLESSYRICLLEFVRQAMKLARGRLYFAGVLAMVLNVLLVIPYEEGWIFVSAWLPIQVLVFLPYYACILTLLYRGGRTGEKDGRLLFGPMALWFLSDSVINLAAVRMNAGSPRAGAILDRLNAVTTWPFRMQLNDIAFLLFEASVLAILLLRFVRSRREEERMKSELQAAALVQQVIVPTENPVIPGFRIESVYKPAEEVAGDFFQVVADRQGGAIIAIGDVSGKGMPAAMAVSLLIGTFRTLAHYTHCPAEILTAMNRRMMGRSRGGFTTCLVLRIDPDGMCTAANAGHLAPYRDGEELEIESGIPLGIDEDAPYTESRFELPVGVPLMLLTDGVVEARSEEGELFGFERARAISAEPAERIASAAERFGRQDDITVLALSRTGIPSSGTPVAGICAMDREVSVDD